MISVPEIKELAEEYCVDIRVKTRRVEVKFPVYSPQHRNYDAQKFMNELYEYQVNSFREFIGTKDTQIYELVIIEKEYIK